MKIALKEYDNVIDLTEDIENVDDATEHKYALAIKDLEKSRAQIAIIRESLNGLRGYERSGESNSAVALFS